MDDARNAHPPISAKRLTARLLDSNHKANGLRYLWLALLSVFLGMAMSLLMRMHLVWPEMRIPLLTGMENSPERYAALTTLHGSLMVFFVLIAAPQLGFGTYFLPLQLGARDMAFPKLTLLSLWASGIALIGFMAAFFAGTNAGITVWVASAGICCLAGLAGALNFIVTTVDMRADGMSLPRLPLTVWAWFVNAILSFLVFSMLLGACVFLLSDRIWHSQFFVVPEFARFDSPATAPAREPLGWQRLFWFFAQAEVYIAMLPCFGTTAHLLSTFSRKPVWMERGVVLALCAVGSFGFCVWGQHAFVSGLNPYSPLVFSTLAASLGLPASFLLMSWLGTLWNARIQLNTAMLFALGFVSLFVSGGISGIFLARHDLESVAVNDDFITGHFHLVMGVAATFAILGALFFWFPKMFGRHLNETLGKAHFWLTFAGVYAIFMPMHWLGLVAHSRATPGMTLSAVSAAGISMKSFITMATLLTVAAQGIFLANFLLSVFSGERTRERNPWNSTTLEWSVDSPPPADNFGTEPVAVYRGAYELANRETSKEFLPQFVAPPPDPKSQQARK